MFGNRCDRREFLKAGGAGAAAFMLGGCVDAARRAGGTAALRKPNVVHAEHGLLSCFGCAI